MLPEISLGKSEFLIIPVAIRYAIQVPGQKTTCYFWNISHKPRHSSHAFWCQQMNIQLGLWSTLWSNSGTLTDNLFLIDRLHNAWLRCLPMMVTCMLLAKAIIFFVSKNRVNFIVTRWSYFRKASTLNLLAKFCPNIGMF